MANRPRRLSQSCLNLLVSHSLLHSKIFIYMGFCSHAAVELGRKLFPLFALALDLSEDFFEDKVHKPLFSV